MTTRQGMPSGYWLTGPVGWTAAIAGLLTNGINPVLPAGPVVLLVAVVHSTNDPVSLTELPLRDLTLSSPHVPVRSVLVRT